MPHMVSPILNPTSLNDTLTAVTAAHALLVKAAKESLPGLGVTGDDNWGATAKRTPVVLPPKDRRPACMADAADRHAFAEVVNQCATLERLIDVLDWAISNLGDYEVKTCHPTTSSQKAKDQADNDLILFRKVDGHYCRFEISDVASSTADGNGKELKDLKSLGVQVAAEGQSWPPDRVFLVVSTEFSKYLMQPTRHGLKAGRIHYREAGVQGATRIIEVLPGARENAIAELEKLQPAE